MKRQLKVGFAAMAVLAAACSDGDSFGPEAFDAASVAVAPVCETITFNTTGGATDHMQTWGGTTIFGVNVTASGSRYADPGGNFAAASLAPRLFYSPIELAIEDNDLQYPDEGAQYPGGANYGGSDVTNIGPACEDCETLNLQHVLVIEDARAVDNDPAFWGDYRYGGTIQLDFAGLPANTYYVQSWRAVDDDGGEPSIDLYADGTTLVSQSTGTGDATVETVTSAGVVYFNSSLTFQFGDEPANTVTGSGAIDDIVICKVPPPPGAGTRTPGYWKNDKKEWPLASVNIGGIVYTRAQADDLMEHPTAKDKTYNMFEQLVATTLNLANGTDASCIASVVAEANAWMAEFGPVGSGITASSSEWKNVQAGYTMSAADMHSTLDQYNNGLLCAPKAD